LGRIGFERQSVVSKIVFQVAESRDLFILNRLRRYGSHKTLIYNSFLSVTFGMKITTRPVWLLGQIRRSGITEQRAAYDWLKRKFEAEG
jgi:hypothetical protein